jgi:hypothetical protein
VYSKNNLSAGFAACQANVRLLALPDSGRTSVVRFEDRCVDEYTLDSPSPAALTDERDEITPVVEHLGNLHPFRSRRQRSHRCLLTAADPRRQSRVDFELAQAPKRIPRR